MFPLLISPRGLIVVAGVVEVGVSVGAEGAGAVPLRRAANSAFELLPCAAEAPLLAPPEEEDGSPGLCAWLG